jgi:hypothetical protein
VLLVYGDAGQVHRRTRLGAPSSRTTSGFRRTLGPPAPLRHPRAHHDQPDIVYPQVRDNPLFGAMGHSIADLGQRADVPNLGCTLEGERDAPLHRPPHCPRSRDPNGEESPSREAIVHPPDEPSAVPSSSSSDPTTSGHPTPLAQTDRHVLPWGYGAETLDADGVEGDVVAAGDLPFPSIRLPRFGPPAADIASHGRR